MATNLETGKIPGYETTWICRAELSDEGLKTLQDRITAIIGTFGGEVVLTEDWGKRKLAYPMQRETRGHYQYFVYTGKPGVVAEIERNLRIHEHVLRFLSVNLAREFDSEIYRKLRADQKAAAKRREEEREARAEERRAADAEGGGDGRRRGGFNRNRDRDSAEGGSPAAAE
ncbi:MAG: 30S ribosomal protein S6 [Bdellovibrionota bacterium]